MFGALGHGRSAILGRAHPFGGIVSIRPATEIASVPFIPARLNSTTPDGPSRSQSAGVSSSGRGRGVTRFVPFSSTSPAPSAPVSAPAPSSSSSSPPAAADATANANANAIPGGAGRGNSGARLAWERSQPRVGPPREQRSEVRGYDRERRFDGDRDRYQNRYQNQNRDQGQGSSFQGFGSRPRGQYGNRPDGAGGANANPERRNRLQRYAAAAGKTGGGAMREADSVVFTSSTALGPLGPPTQEAMSEDAFSEMLAGCPSDWPQGVDSLPRIVERLKGTPLEHALDRTWRGLLHNTSLAPAQRDQILSTLTDRVLSIHKDLQ